MTMDMLGMDAGPPPAAPEAEQEPGADAELESYMTTFMAAAKAGQARKAANAMKNFIEACSGSERKEPEGMY